MLLNSLEAIIARLRRGKKARSQFVESHINKTLANQIRATRDRLGWSQEKLASEVGMNQNAISRLESSDYGKPTITTLKRLASAMDVALVVRFVPFTELSHWVGGRSYLSKGLSTESLAVPDFAAEEESGALDLALVSMREDEALEQAMASTAMDSQQTGITVNSYSMKAAHTRVFEITAGRGWTPKPIQTADEGVRPAKRPPQSEQLVLMMQENTNG